MNLMVISQGINCSFEFTIMVDKNVACIGESKRPLSRERLKEDCSF
jgi:hypothetical protein